MQDLYHQAVSFKMPLCRGLNAAKNLEEPEEVVSCATRRGILGAECGSLVWVFRV